LQKGYNGKEDKMEGIFHTGITVSNLDRSVEFYRDVLGLELIMEQTQVFKGEQLSKSVGVPNANVRQAVLSTGEGELELVQYVTPNSPVGEPMPLNTLGAMHVAFRVKDAVKKMEELEAKGIEFLSPLNIEEEGPLAGLKWVYFKDPDGITLELLESEL
jgi:catechol 2,3-dioxygenase-like lactoylglutathione lyase family enzyme